MGNQRIHSFIKELNLVGRVVSDVRILANAFNSYFVLPEPVYEAPYECVGRSPDFSLFLSPVGAHEVQLYLQSIALKKAAAADEVPMILVIRVAQFVASPLAEVINCSFSEGIFPEKFKWAVVTPLFQKGNRLYIQNYRPISVLLTFSKALEWSFLIRIVNFS
jgi:hypothetical protein